MVGRELEGVKTNIGTKCDSCLPTETRAFRRCTGCRLAAYCDRACQRALARARRTPQTHCVADERARHRHKASGPRTSTSGARHYGCLQAAAHRAVHLTPQSPGGERRREHAA
ncbi:hypothetical protein BV25DRAFT_1366084 [Artomyces pyxidatus]|uniref:Uncharacterized protein n=1 Tax=Artomyces pyxidatus TaxID=48021 RepID=A0ACB8SMZ2_9AGAM|nr:hypothetical protein BV25DRAFT_1366084 [Artomyces pyxidatus]